MPTTDEQPGDNGKKKMKKTLGHIPHGSKNSNKSPKKKKVQQTKQKDPGIYPRIDYGITHECVVLKFSCGEEIMCFVDSKQPKNSKLIRIYYPANFIMHSKGIKLQQWIPMNRCHWYDIQRAHVTMISPCNDEAADRFCEVINQFTNTQDKEEEKAEVAASLGRVPSNRRSVISKKFIDTYSEVMTEIGLTVRHAGDMIVDSTQDE